MKKITIIGIIFILFSCSTNNKQVREVFSENGKLIRKYLYTDLNDTSSYIMIEYFDNGDTETIIPVIKGKINGIVKVFYPNKKIWLIRRYVNGEYHGATYEYNKDLGYLQREILYLNSEQIIDVQYGRAIDCDTLFGVSYYYPVYYDDDTTFLPVGSLTWNKEGQKPKKYQTYYEVEAEDTIKMGERYKIDLKFNMGLYDDLSIELELGDLDNEFNFIDTTKITKYTSNNLQLDFEITNYELGDNLLLGKIKLFRNRKNVTTEFLNHPRIKEYIFYHQFEVIE